MECVDSVFIFYMYANYVKKKKELRSDTQVRVNGKYAKTAQCNFQVQTTETGYCIVLFIMDERCHEDTIWRPPMNNKTSCTWVKREYKL